MKAFTCLILFLLTFSVSQAQNEKGKLPNQVWHEGNVFLNDGTSLKGFIKYDLKNDLLQLSSNGKIKAFVASQLSGFRFFQKGQDKYRDFVTLRFEGSKRYKRPRFFEIIYENETSLLAREFVNYTDETRVNSLATTGVGRLHRVRVGKLKYQYFLIDVEGNFKTISAKVKHIAKSFGKHQSELESYIKDNRLEFEKMNDMVLLVAHYNSLDMIPY